MGPSSSASTVPTTIKRGIRDQGQRGKGHVTLDPEIQEAKQEGEVLARKGVRQEWNEAW